MAAPSGLAPPRSRLILERVLGLTALSNAMVAVNPVSGELAYAAGCIVVVYNLRRNKQVRYYRVDKRVACLCFSPNGQFLAIGEQGYLPAITIWDGTDGTLCAELQRHQYGVACMAFSKDGRLLLSAGLVHDQHIYAWALKLKKKEAARRLKVTAVGCALVEDKILAADYCESGNFFVTVGEKHFKYWFLDDSGSFLVTGLHANELPELQHRDAVISGKTASTFTDVGCGYGACQLKTFAVTADGTLCCFGASGIMERLVSLESNRGNAISVTESYIAVGGSSSIVRLFDPSTLEYRTTLPFPPAFGTANDPPESLASSSELHPAEPFRYPAVIAVRISGSHVIVFYSDRSIFIFCTADPDAVTVERSFLFHSGGIRDLEVAGSVNGVSTKGKIVYGDGTSSAGGSAWITPDIIPTGTFVTCSDDNTVRMWHLELHRRPVKSSRFESSPKAGTSGYDVWKNPYSQELLRVIYNDRQSDFEDENCVVLGGTCTNEDSNSVHSPPKGLGRNKGFRTVAIRPDQREVASGDQEGNVVVIPAALETPVIRIDAHSSKVNCLTYSGHVDENDGTIFMASGGKDRLIQLYDCKSNHAVLSTLESHSSAVMTVALSRNGKVLLSSGADDTVSVASINAKGDVLESKMLPVNSGKMLDMALLPDNDSIVVSCNNRLEILSADSGKYLKSHLVGEQHHIAICPANFCVAMSGSLAERTIHVANIITGEMLAAGMGHSEAITALKFTPDCRRLLSASSDGCIFVWRLADDIQREIKAHLPNATEDQGPIPMPPPPSADTDFSPSMLPPPAPPISGAKKLDITNCGVGDDKKTLCIPPGTAIAKETNDSDNNISVVEAKEVLTAATSRVSNIPPRDWKGKVLAVPGPMADIPMEEWMRTRPTAQPTIHVANDSHSGQRVGQQATRKVFGGTLAIDRSQTPDWAKTEPTVVDQHEPVLTTVGGTPTKSQPSAGKWSNQVAVVFPNGDDIPIEVNPHTSQTSISSTVNAPSTSLGESGNDEIGNLAVDILASNPTSSTSLALEREQLEKRKKQIDTANAVAAMNTRLSQLGLLRPSPKQETTPKSKMESKFTPSPLKRKEAPRITNNGDSKIRNVPSSLAVEENSNGTSVSTTPPEKLTKRTIPAGKFQPPDIPVEMLESFEILPFPPPKDAVATTPAVELVKLRKEEIWQEDEKSASEKASSTPSFINYEVLPPGEIADESSSSDEDADKVTDELVSQALSELEREKLAGPIAAEPVEASLSVFTAGYNREDLKGEQYNDDQLKCRSQADYEVDASLSAFTSGFKSHVEPSHTNEEGVQCTKKKKRNGRINKRLHNGVFRQSWRQKGEENPGEKDFDRSTDVSMSTFTLGYSQVTNESLANMPQDSEILVDMSLSNFTSGYGNEKPSAFVPPANAGSVAAGQPPPDLVKASLSAFTAGYCAEVSPMAITQDPLVVPADKSADVLAPSLLLTSTSLERNGDDISLVEAMQCAGETADQPKVIESKLQKSSVRPKLQKLSVGVKASETAAMNAISELEQPLEDAAMALEKVFLRHDPVSDADPKLQEIQRLVAALRAAINDAILDQQ